MIEVVLTTSNERSSAACFAGLRFGIALPQTLDASDQVVALGGQRRCAGFSTHLFSSSFGAQG